MPRLSKPHRLTAALVALSFSLGIVLPMVQHVCAMDHAAAMTHAAPAPNHCDGHPTPASDARAFSAQASPSEMPCCLVGPTAPHVETPALLPTGLSPGTALLPPVAVLLSVPDDADSADHPPVTSPPAPAPIALHVLHATFLN